MAKAGKGSKMEMNCEDKDARCYKVVDAETGIMVRDVIWANDETGEYDQFKRDENGKVFVAENGEGLAYERKTGKIKFVVETDPDRIALRKAIEGMDKERMENDG